MPFCADNWRLVGVVTRFAIPTSIFSIPETRDQNPCFKSLQPTVQTRHLTRDKWRLEICAKIYRFWSGWAKILGFTSLSPRWKHTAWQLRKPRSDAAPTRFTSY
jgi:hypothetical protein